MPVPLHPYDVVSYVYVVLIVNRGTYGIEIVQGHINMVAGSLLERSPRS